jgi:hypothetical protein
LTSLLHWQTRSESPHLSPVQSRLTSPQPPPSPGIDSFRSNAPTPAPGTAVQLIEYANGQVVWSVVDGLRAAGEAEDWDINDYLDDSTSVNFDPRRASAQSGHSSVPNSGNGRGEEAMQLLFREHRRMASKESNASSYVSRHRVLPPSQRPETKVRFVIGLC